MYLTSSAFYSADLDEFNTTLQTAFRVSLKLKNYSNALRVAIRLDDIDLIQKCFIECKDRAILKQMSLEIGRQRISLPDLDEELTKIVSNSHINEFYIKLAKDLEVDEPKHPDQIYKSHLEERKGTLYILNLSLIYI